MSRYDDANVSEQLMGDARLLMIESRGVRLLYLEALVWSRGHRTDGAIAKHMLRRITDEPDPEQAAGQLVASGLWATVDGGWQIIDFETTQLRREVVEREQVASRDRWERYRDKRNANGVANGAATALPTGLDRLSESELSTRSHERSSKGRPAGAAASRGRRTPRAPDDDDQELCFYCGQLAPEGLRLERDDDGTLHHPSVDEIEQLPEEWRPYFSDGETCPETLPGHDVCGWCLGDHPVKEMEDMGDGMGDGNYMCRSCQVKTLKPRKVG